MNSRKDLDMRTMKERPIGMFDSGVGGLSILRVFLEELPHEDVVYLADTVHFPYGKKTAEEIEGFGRNIAEHFKKVGVKLVIIACNTATVYSLKAVQEVMGDIPVIGVIGAGARAAVESKGESIGVIATDATIRSHAYSDMIRSLGETAQVTPLATQRLGTLVEEGDVDSDHARAVIREELSPLLDDPPSLLMLGCTHFPGLSHLIVELLPEVKLIDPAYALVKEASDYLEKENLLRVEGGGKVEFLVTGDPMSFAKNGSLLLGHPIKDAKKLIL